MISRPATRAGTDMPRESLGLADGADADDVRVDRRATARSAVEATANGSSDDVAHRVADPEDRARLTGLRRATKAVTSVRVDELSDSRIDAELGVLEQTRRQIESRTTRLVAARSKRAARRARERHPGDQRAPDRAERKAHEDVAGLLNWTPGRAKRASRDGEQLDSLPQSAKAADRGEIGPRHARLLYDTLRHFDNPQRDLLEAELIEAAKRQNPVVFGRTCRRRLAELNPDAAVRAELRKKSRQKATLFQTDQGTVVLNGEWSGLDAEYVATAVHAFRRPDRPDEHRRTEQRTADALVEVCKAALDAAKAPTNRGARPHVIVRVDMKTILERAGVADTDWNGSFPWEILRKVLDDAGLSWLPTPDPDQALLLEASPEVRTVPRGLHRYLHDRDHGCIRDGCDMPAKWCDVMHLQTPHRDGGRLSPRNAALGCRTDHRLYDAGHLKLEWRDGRPSLRPYRPGERESETEHRQRDGPSP